MMLRKALSALNRWRGNAEEDDADKWIRARDIARADLVASGFREWIYSRPPPGPVECTYDRNPTHSFEADLRTMHPATNISGLWWRPIRPQVEVGSAPLPWENK
jgi:hypothetical protein